MGGSIANPLLRTDLKEALSAEASGLRQQAVSLVQAKVDSAKQQFRDTARAVGKQVAKTAGDELKKQIWAGRIAPAVPLQAWRTAEKRQRMPGRVWSTGFSKEEDTIKIRAPLVWADEMRNL